ncbi:hypothetical protein J5N97_011323 [Dioscorea zingiberensis]|uniref:GDSL esterase/lipase n=1 Tax=Dioscorea zingiberensis TaxID=325984 RepID=A0A9D5D0Y3_9LILI|nr:hypothetical protein J5N97_011323 [Dioscorea zingiberensis]
MASSQVCHLVFYLVMCFLILCSCAFGRELKPAMYLFGDSFLDIGNNNYLTSGVKANYYPYGIDYIEGEPTGRWGNGKNSMDFLVEMLGVSSPQPSLSFNGTSNMVEEFLKGANFASGGAGILDTTYLEVYCIPLGQQVELFKEMVVATIEQIGIVQTYEHISNSFIVIDIGSNDITIVADITIDPEEYVALLISTLQPRLKDLYIFGGRKFVTISAGALGCIPILRGKTETGECHEQLNVIAKLYNKELASLMQVLQSQSSNGDLHYSFFDRYAGVKKLYDNRESLGFTEVLVACCGAGNFNGSVRCTPGTVPCSNRTDHIYWDNTHYTEAFTSLCMELAFQGSAPYVHPINVKQLGELPISYVNPVNVEQVKDL